MKRGSKYFRIGMTVFLTVGAILLFYDTLFGTRAIVTLFAKLNNALLPIFYGALIAYLLAPAVDFFEQKLFPATVLKARREGRYCAAGPRAVSLLIIWILIGVLAYLLLSVLLPELNKSVLQLFNNLEKYYKTVTNWFSGLLAKNPDVESWVTVRIDKYYNDLTDLISQRLLPRTQQIMTAVSGGIQTALTFLKNLVVGIIVSVYLLATKERCAAHSRKLIYSLFSRKTTDWMFRGIHRVDEIFAGFVRGKLLDSLIIGIICFFLCSIFRIPYASLVSTIVGVTNVIPFFGPFLGAIPSLFLILLVDPMKALYFLILIIALQQVDGNIIGPKILSGRTGLSSLWVIIAILVGGSFFGIPGMFFGVPVFACFHSLISYLINGRLRKKNLPVSSEAYRTRRPGGAPPENPPETPGDTPPQEDKRP